MKNLKIKPLSLVCLLFLFFSCNKSEDTIAPESIGLEQQDVNSFSGEKEINNRQLKYNVTLNEDEYYFTQLTIDEQLLSAKVYFSG